MYPIVTDLNDEYMGIVRDIAILLSKGVPLSLAYDMAWGHKTNAKQGSGCLIEMLTRGIVARYHCCKNKNLADPLYFLYKDSSHKLSSRRDRRPRPKQKAKSAQVWVGKFLRESKTQEEAVKLLKNFLNHLIADDTISQKSYKD
jgi:hypothetical protein